MLELPTAPILATRGVLPPMGAGNDGCARGGAGRCCAPGGQARMPALPGLLPGLLLREARIGLHSRNLLIVANIVKRYVDQPVIRVESSEDGKWMVQCVLLQGDIGLLGKLKRLCPGLLEAAKHLGLCQLSGRPDQFRSLSAARPAYKDALEKLRFGRGL